MAIISHCNDERNSVQLALRYMKLSNGNFVKIEKALCAIGHKYEILTDKSKRPSLEGKHYQLELLNYLKGLGYIASFKKEIKEKNTVYRVYPTKNKE